MPAYDVVFETYRIATSMKLTLSISYTQLSNEELSCDDSKLIKAAEDIAQQAYAPYSQFKVGAALLLENGVIITGSNQENAAYPSGLCAERTALFYAGAQYPDIPIVSLAIVAFNTEGKVTEISPCGGCRQVIMEASCRFKPFRLLLSGREHTIILDDARSILPFGFDDSKL